jgi:hypothetical protein
MRYFLLILLLVFVPHSTNYKNYTDTDIHHNVKCKSLDKLILNQYMSSIGLRESSGRYDVVNTFGYLGKYQFSPVTLYNLGFDVGADEFLKNPQLQDSAMVSLLIHNYEILNRVINEFDGSVLFDDYIITTSGILAAAHLIGPHRTRILLEDGIDTKDGYGTSALSYLVEFSGYNINLNF